MSRDRAQARRGGHFTPRREACCTGQSTERIPARGVAGDCRSRLFAKTMGPLLETFGRLVGIPVKMIPMSRLFLLFTVLLAATFYVAPTFASNADDDARTSLEELLAEEAAKRAKIEAELLPRVTALLDSLSGLSTTKPGDSRVQKIHLELISLGAPATPLIVGALDPGSNARKRDLFLATRVTDILSKMETAPITSMLIEIAENGTDRGRRGAILVLGNSEEKERAGKVLFTLFHDSSLGLELTALRALAKLGGPHGAVALQEALSGTEDVVNEALAALAEHGAGESLPLVSPLLASDSAGHHAAGLLAYFQANTLKIDREDTKNIVRLAANRLVEKSTRRKILLTLPDLDVDWNSGNGKLLAAAKEDSDSKLSQAALICLARFGHKSELKLLLKPYKAAIDQDPLEPRPLEDRAEINISLHEYEDALKDYTKAIKLYEDKRNSSVYAANSAFIGAARAHILNGDTRDAAKVLEDSALSTLQLRALADDPDFASLVADKKHSKVLRLR